MHVTVIDPDGIELAKSHPEGTTLRLPDIAADALRDKKRVREATSEEVEAYEEAGEPVIFDGNDENDVDDVLPGDDEETSPLDEPFESFDYDDVTGLGASSVESLTDYFAEQGVETLADIVELGADKIAEETTGIKSSAIENLIADIKETD